MLACQVLWHHVRIEVDAPEAEDALRLLVQGATHDEAPLATAELRVRGDAAHGYVVEDRGDRLAEVATAREVLDEVFARVHRRAFELASLRGFVRFHGAVARVGGQRVGVVGPSGAGKTTLAVALLAGGADVETDESFVAKGSTVFSVARRLHVKPGTLARVPEATWVGAAPVLDGDPSLHLVDPTAVGRPWHVRSGPLDHLVLLERVDGPSELVSAAATEAVQALIAESFPVVERRGTVVRRASELAASVPVHRLANGPDGAAPALLARLGNLVGEGGGG